jgi:site-specific DNA recombinase
MEQHQEKTATQGQNTAVLEDLKSKVRYCLYARKSTEQDELQALSIDSQIKEMLDMANKENMDIAEIRRESHSAKDSGQRPVFNQLLTDIRQGMFTGILCWAPDRLSRNAGDLGSTVDLMDQGRLVEIRTHSQTFTNNPNEKFLLMILGSQAKLENDHKGENVKRGLRAKCEQGWRPGMPPLGYLHDKFADKGQKKVYIDPDRAPYIKQMFELVAYENYSGRQIDKWIKKNNLKTKKSKNISLSMIYRILADPYYYGEFEYPVGSGKLYKGGYDPIISKELFLKARENLTTAPRRHPGTVEFAFTKLLYCDNCGSGICAEEKFKHQKNGNTHRYVYYHCTRGKDKNCREKPIREEDLIKQMVKLVDRIEVDQLKINEKVKAEMERFRKFTFLLGQNSEQLKNVNLDARNYAKYILLEGSKEEKRELLECMSGKVVLKNRELFIE